MMTITRCPLVVNRSIKRHINEPSLPDTSGPSSPKSILRRNCSDTLNKRVKSKVSSFLPRADVNGNKILSPMMKKSVRFAPGTVMVDRESKPFNRMLPKPRSPSMPNLFSSTAETDDDMKEGLYTAKITQSASASLVTKTKSSPDSSSSQSTKLMNDYTRFTLAKRAPDHALHTEMDRLPTRVKRLFENIENLQVAHVAYNSLPSTEVREKFLLDQVIRRQIVSLEISMSEGLIHFAMDVIDTMYEATQFIRSLYHNDFYNPDGSHTLLPIIMNNEQDDYINKLAPVVYSLNRISGDRRRSDNSCMGIETVCTKLQLEMISLTICPAKSLMFRSILEVVPSTALRARQLLEGVESKSSIKWINNSLMRKDYTKILLSYNLIDKQDIVTKFPVMKKTSKKVSIGAAGGVKSKEKKLAGPVTSNKAPPSNINPAEKGDISIPCL